MGRAYYAARQLPCISYTFRFPVLDNILRAIESLSTTDDYSQEISSNMELVQLICNLVKLPDKMEVLV